MGKPFLSRVVSKAVGRDSSPGLPDRSLIAIGCHIQHTGLGQRALAVTNQPAGVGPAITVGGPPGIDHVIQQEQSLPLGILPRIKDDVAIAAVVALARVLGLDRNRPTEFFLSGDDVQSVNALEIFTRGVLAHGYHVDGAVRTAGAIDDGSRSDADLR